MMNWVQQVEQLIFAGQADQALLLLDELKNVSDKREQRIMLHLRGQALVYSGDLEGAKGSYLMAQKYFGDNIALTRDLACLYYQTGETHQWRAATQKLHGDFKAVEHQLNPKVRIETEIILGKFLEEEGRVAEAREFYLRADQEAHACDLLQLQLLALIQKLRIEAIYSRGPQIGDWYRHLLSTPHHDLSFDLWVEREHSLMLTEVELVGPQHAYTRVRQLFQNPKVSAADRRLALADYFAETLIRHLKPNEEQLGMASCLKEGDGFEREIYHLVTNPELKDHLERLNEAAIELSWACYLRLLTILHEMARGTSLQPEISNKLSLLLSTLSPNSRYFWMKRVQTLLLTEDMSLELHAKSHTLVFQGKAVDLSKKRTLLAVMKALVDQREIEVEIFIRQLWQSDFTPEHLHRLRMAVHRLNQILFDLCATPRMIEMTAEKVSLKATILVKKVI